MVTCAKFASLGKPSQPLQGSPSLAFLWPSPDPHLVDLTPTPPHWGAFGLRPSGMGYRATDGDAEVLLKFLILLGKLGTNGHFWFP